MTPQTQMLIGSQSKSFTALAIAQLAEQGKLDLNAPVQTYIPWFRVADETASARITVNHLLHHTSGLSDSGFGVVLPDDATPEQAVRSLAQAQLTAPVGSKHQYFNLGYTTLAYIIELVSGQSYADYVQAHILAPLGMDSSTADPARCRPGAGLHPPVRLCSPMRVSRSRSTAWAKASSSPPPRTWRATPLRSWTAAPDWSPRR
jgi:CubicO group peptidase (beta-lactamase class C family)